MSGSNLIGKMVGSTDSEEVLPLYALYGAYIADPNSSFTTQNMFRFSEYAISRSVLLLCFAVGSLGVLIGCDTARNTDSDGTADQSDGANEVVIESESFTKANLKFELMSVSPEDTFSITLGDEDPDQNEPRIIHEGTKEGNHNLRAEFDPLQPSSISVECRNENTGTTRNMATVRSKDLKSDGSHNPVANTRDFPSSFYYINDGNNILVSVDYGGLDLGTMVNFPSSEKPVECTHVSFVLEEVDSSFSAEGIRFGGIDHEPTFRHRQFE